MCKSNSDHGVNQLGRVWLQNGKERTISGLVFDPAASAEPGGCHENTPSIRPQTRGTTDIQNPESTARSGALPAVSGRRLFRGLRPVAGQIRNAAMRGSGRPECAIQRAAIRVFAGDMVQDPRALCPRWNSRTATRSTRAQVAPKKTQPITSPCVCANEVRQEYERLRNQAIKRDESAGGTGLIVLLSFGMAAWIKALEAPPTGSRHARVPFGMLTVDSTSACDWVSVLSALAIGTRRPLIQSGEVRHD